MNSNACDPKAWNDRTIPQRSRESEMLQDLLQRLQQILDEHQTTGNGCQCGKNWLAIGSEVAVVPRTAPAFVIGRTADGVKLRYWQAIGSNEGQWCEDEFSIDRIVVPISLLTGGDRKNHV